MNNMNAVSAHPFIRDDYSKSENASPPVKTNWKTILDRILVLVSLTIIGVCLSTALHPNHFMLTAVFGWLGLWATNRLSAENSYRVAPALVFLNLVCFPEAYIALPVAALTVGLSQDFQVDESVREALRLSGLTGAAITLLCMLG
jgi:hypothetical protein